APAGMGAWPGQPPGLSSPRPFRRRELPAGPTSVRRVPLRHDAAVDVIAPSKLGKGGRDVAIAPRKPFVGALRVKARPVAPDQRLEASLASRWGNPPGEA